MKSTKRSLLLSTLSLIMCVAMLLGTTYAWFTDSVTSGRNKIVAGNLDVELYHGKTLPIAQIEANSVKDATELFGVSLWEPGVVAYENFTVANVGNLALKYALNLNVFDKNATTAGNDLTEVIKVAVVDGGFTGNRAEAQAITGFQTLADFQKTGNLAAKNDGDTDETTYGIVLYWQPTDNDNLYNLKNGLASTDGQPLFVEFGVNLVATQDTVEADSFDNQYDATAPLAVMSTPMTKKLANTESLKIVVPEEAESSVKEATVPAAVANAVFDEVFTESTTSDKSLTLVLNVEEKSKTNTTFNYEIDMDAVIKEVDGSTVITNETKSVNELGLTFTDFVEVQMNIDSGLSNVKVKHNGNDMKEVADLAAAKAFTPEVAAGYYNYQADGLTKLWIKSFSPFTVTGEKEPDPLVLTLTGEGKVSGEIGGHTFILGFPSNNQIAQGHTSASLTITEVKEADANKAWKVTYPTGIKYYTFVMDDGYGTTDPSANIYVKDATEVEPGANTVMDRCGLGYSCTIGGFEGNYYMIGAIYNK